jgi:hypothetical protein
VGYWSEVDIAMSDRHRIKASPAPPPPAGLTITRVCPVCGCAQWRRIDVLATTPADGPVVLLACQRCGLTKVAP